MMGFPGGFRWEQSLHVGPVWPRSNFKVRYATGSATEKVEEPLTTQLDKWTIDELFSEVLNRSAGDRPTLNHIGAMILRAVLADCDQKAATDAGAEPHGS
jgi:hypothetical protein